MSFFDFLKGGKKDGGEPISPTRAASLAAKWSDRAADKRAQNYDRQEALAALAALGTVEAAAALLKRFTFTIDPSITDQEEKDIAFDGVLKIGKPAVEPIRVFAAKAESLAWPLRILRKLLDDEEYVQELLLWLSKWDIEYAKFTDPKVQILTALEEMVHADVAAAVERFLEDVGEPARFQAVATTLAQGDAGSAEALSKVLVQEESFRIRNKILDGFLHQGWVVPEAHRAGVQKVLPSGISIDSSGHLAKG